MEIYLDISACIHVSTQSRLWLHIVTASIAQSVQQLATSFKFRGRNTETFFHMLDVQLFLQSHLATGNTHCFLFTCSTLKYFFSLISQLEPHTISSHAWSSTFSSVSSRNWQHTIFSHAGSSTFSSVSSRNWQHTVFFLHARRSTISSVSSSNWQHTMVFFYMSDAPLFLHSQLLSGTHKLFFSHAGSSTISSVSSRNWQHKLFFFYMSDAPLFLQSQLLSGNTMCCIACWMLRCLPGISA